MAWTKTYEQYKRWHRFAFFEDAVASNDGMEVALNFSAGEFILDEVRLHLSVVHASIEDFKVKLSSIFNSVGDEHNITLMSQAMLDIKDVLWQAGSMMFQSGDSIWFSMHLSNANTYGLTVTGWAVVG